MKSSPRLLFPFILVFFASLACAGGLPTVAPSSGEPPTRPAPANHTFGVAGLIPRNFPNSSADDWLNLYETLDETGGLLGVYTNWSDSPDTAGSIPKVVRTAFGLAPQYNFTPVVALGFHRDAPGGGLEPTLVLSDAGEREEFKAVAVAIAHTYQPKYLALGVEVNRLYNVDPAGFDDYVSLYAETYDAIKAASPDTLVFPIFQLELMKGKGYLTGNSEGRQPQWELLDRFDARLDLAAFTTYPYFDYGSPADIPADYYSEIAARTTRPLAFTEIGWPSAPLAPAPDSEYGGSEEEQAAFVKRFFGLTANTNLAIALWSFPHDLDAAPSNAAFDSVSLRRNDGTPKPALAEWLEAIHGLTHASTPSFSRSKILVIGA